MVGRSKDGAIWSIPAEGKPFPVTTLGEAEFGHVLPSVLPGGRALLYTVRKGKQTWGRAEVVAQTLATGTRTRLLTNATDARYVPTGHLVFMRLGRLFAVPFDAERLQPRGREAPVIEGVAQCLRTGTVDDQTGAGQYAVSPTGLLAWVSGTAVPRAQSQLVTVDRRGQVTPLWTPPAGSPSKPRLSPDGRRLAVRISSDTEDGLWIYDLGRGARCSR